MAVATRSRGPARSVTTTPPAPAQRPAPARKPSSPGAPSSLPCPSVSFSHPFLAWGDRGSYTLLGGEAPDSFTGEGWKLSGGAKIVTARLRDGHTGTVLSLPAGARALTPMICLTSDYPKARTMVTDVAGRRGVALYVSFYEHGAWTRNVASGLVKGLHARWRASTPIMIHAASLKSQTPARFTLVGTGRRSSYDIYDFYVDPRLSN
ncbi:MAG TPA: hypothetical protein VE992_08000 [Solirubrobacteraceae bacterium]|nr:hypothetical protein [Solirubrobacteraceae bacterium]